MAVDANQAKSLFLAASDLSDPVERAAYLDRECLGNSSLRARVEVLLKANDASPLPPPGSIDDATGTFRGGVAAARAILSGKDELIGAILGGKYKLIEVVGEGGMGSVYLAQQTEPVKRAVAIKVIKAGMDSKAVLARFEAERQALAMMDHPNIAKVLDGGLHEGKPYFVMELVKGVTITKYCDENKMTPRQRLELFVPVCQAIQHAHQKGIIHRDIKPSNVLVAVYDDKPVPKVIDFGIAKATGGSLSEHTIETAFGGIVGTPQYMSPEQASLNNTDIDTRSDVYSLGILLYELLTGSPPYARKDLERKGFLEILRVVREEEAPRPSARLSTDVTLPSVSVCRGTEPKKLTALLRNELDWIVMKSLEKDRARRYGTVNGFAADVLRFLSGEPVHAHPPTAAYRLKKFVRKNRLQVIAAGLVMVALVAGVVGTSWQAIRADTARAAEADRAEGERQAKLLAESERAAADAKRAEADAQRVRAEANMVELRDAVRRYTALLDGDARLQEFDLSDVKTKLYTQSTQFYEIIVEQSKADPAVRAECASAWMSLAAIHRLKSRNADALAACQRAVKHYSAAVALQDRPALLLRTAQARSELSALYNINGDKVKGTESIEDALRTIEPCLTHEDPVWQTRAAVFRALYRDALVSNYLRDNDDTRATVLHRQATADLPEYDSVSPQDRNTWLYASARLACKAGRLDCKTMRVDDAIRAFAQSEEFLTRLLKLTSNEPARAEAAQGYMTAGSSLASIGKSVEAVAYYRKAEALYVTLIAKYPSVKAYSVSLTAVQRAIATSAGPSPGPEVTTRPQKKN
jgi:serine/threonine protein kinase/tetratricopeptide (TPR) repeat protein